MLVESKEERDNKDVSTIYTVFLPLLEGQFRAALQGNEQNQVEICFESGEFLFPKLLEMGVVSFRGRRTKFTKRNDFRRFLWDAGDDDVKTDHGTRMVYLHAGANPFDVVNEAVK